MKKAFVDTTILCNALELSGGRRAQSAVAALREYSSTETPYYALRELRAGPLSSWILAHNVLTAENSIEDAVERLGRMSAFRPRQGAVTSLSIITGLLGVLDKQRQAAGAGTIQDFDPKTALEDYLAIQILKAWKKRRSITTKVVQPLACFVDSELKLEDRLLKFDGGAECAKGAACGAALELKKRSPVVTQLLKKVFSPPPKGNVEKREKTRRRQALKEVLAKAPADFPRKDCRALGDAYFCVMAPDDSEILTTNASDFEEMADELGKALKIPS